MLAANGVAEMVRDGKSFEATELPRLFKPTMARLLSEKNEILDGLAPEPRAKL